MVVRETPVTVTGRTTLSFITDSYSSMYLTQESERKNVKGFRVKGAVTSTQEKWDAFVDFLMPRKYASAFVEEQMEHRPSNLYRHRTSWLFPTPFYVVLAESN